MNGILFYNLIKIIFPSILFIGALIALIDALIAFIKNRKKLITAIISCIIILISGITLNTSLLQFRNLKKTELIYSKFILLKADEIIEIKIKTKYFKNRSRMVKTKSITDKKNISQILAYLKVSKGQSFEFKYRGSKKPYSLEFKTTENELYKMDIVETSENSSYINLLYFEHNKYSMIGIYKNDLLKELNLSELK